MAIDDTGPLADWNRWWIPAAVAGLALPLILVFGPQYGDLQEAADANAVRVIVGNDRWRYTIAAIIDGVFAGAYGLAVYAVARRTRLPRWTPALVVLGAALDELENMFVVINVLVSGTMVDLMRTIGDLKTRALVGGLVLLVLTAVWVLVRRKRDGCPVHLSDETLRHGAVGLWAGAFVISLAVFASAVRVEAPVVAIVAMGLVAVYSLGRLSHADRRATEGRPAGAMALVYLVPAFIAGAFVAASLVAEVPDVWGFAALGAALYSVVRSFERARWALKDHTTLRLGFTVAALTGAVATLVPVDYVRLVGATVAILSSAVAVELWSSAYPPVLADNRLVVGISGALFLAIALALVGVNDDPVIASAVVLAIGVVTALLLTANDMPILLGVLLFAALWSGVPRQATVPDGLRPEDREPYFAVLGDSYISGEGTDRYFEGTNDASEGGNQCRRSPHAWPMLLNPPATHDTGDVLNVPARVFNRACSGALTADIRHTGDDADGRDQPEQLQLLKQAIDVHGPPKFVLVGIGGNDAQFADVGAACALPGNCTDFLADIRTQRLDGVRDEVARTYAEIRVLVGPTVSVVAIPYPRPLHRDEICKGVLLSQPDISAINDFATALNDQIEQAALRTDTLYPATMEDALSDSAAQLCDPNGQSGLNFADLNPKAGSLWAALDPRNWIHNFVHPNEAGHQALRAAALRWLQDNPCVIDGSCDPKPITDDVRRLAGEQLALPPDVKHGPTAVIADVLPVAVGVLGLLTLAWWLLITASLGWQGATENRLTSSVERTTQVMGPG